MSLMILNVFWFHILIPVLSSSTTPFWGSSRSRGGASSSCRPIICGSRPVLGGASRHEGRWSWSYGHSFRSPVSDLLGGWRRLHRYVRWGPLVLALIFDRCFLNGSLFLLLRLNRERERECDINFSTQISQQWKNWTKNINCCVSTNTNVKIKVGW